MKTSDFYYDLPEELIAQTPLYPRDSSRLMVLQGKEPGHKHFSDIIDYLNEGDALVINETRVIPARLFGVKCGTEREVEFLLLERTSVDEWNIIMRPGKKLRIGDKVAFTSALTAEILEKKEDGVAHIRFEFDGVFEEILDELGQLPLPPYITEKLQDKERYQTVYSKEPGSAAAPTAGLHFTDELLERIEKKGVEIIRVLLHVGLGTFRPVKAETIEDHVMHSEHYCVSDDAAARVNAVHEHGGRVIAVGTTSVRTLESAADDNGILHAGTADTSIFIYPGYKFKCVDAIITNFHLPESTLIMLVSAFYGRERTLEAYKTAVKERYRFFSFGDAMYLDPKFNIGE